MDRIIAREGLTDIAEKVFAAQRLTVADGRAPLRREGPQRARLPGQLRARAQERQRRHLRPQPLPQLLEHLHPELPVLRLRAPAAREERASSLTTSTRWWPRPRAMYDKGITEVHIVGGLHPKLPFSYYTKWYRR
ncbi:MAG: hypothetical protein WDO13_13250 [Verrucomicrobiota bacterium]